MSGKWRGGKGSDPRPIADRKKYEENYEKIFGKKERRPQILWVLCPGYVKSMRDGDVHYVHEKPLRSLYELKYLDYVLTEEEYAERAHVRPEEVHVVRLYPRELGDYREHKAELIAEWEHLYDK